MPGRKCDFLLHSIVSRREIEIKYIFSAIKGFKSWIAFSCLSFFSLHCFVSSSCILCLLSSETLKPNSLLRQRNVRTDMHMSNHVLKERNVHLPWSGSNFFSLLKGGNFSYSRSVAHVGQGCVSTFLRLRMIWISIGISCLAAILVVSLNYSNA